MLKHKEIENKYNSFHTNSTNSNSLKEWCELLKKYDVNKYKIRYIDFNKIPLIKIVGNYIIKIDIKFITPRYTPITQYFRKSKNYFLLYSIIINFSCYGLSLFGGALRSLFNNEDINDLDFRYIYEDDIHESHVVIDINTIHSIIYILYKLIYHEEIEYIDIINHDRFYRLIYKNNIKIDIIDYNMTNYDFHENSLYLDEYLQIKTFKYYKRCYILSSYLVKILLINNNADYNNLLLDIIENNILKIDNENKYYQLLLSYLKIINNDYIMNNILEMIGFKYLCILEIAYYINKKTLRLSHTYCNYYCYCHNNVRYNEKTDNLFLTSNINKLICVRIPKFRERNYKIIFTKCENQHCLYMFIKIIDNYKKNHYVIKFVSFLEKYYNSLYKDELIKIILKKIYSGILYYEQKDKKYIDYYNSNNNMFKKILDNTTTIYKRPSKKNKKLHLTA